MPNASTLDLSAIPAAQRAVVQALLEEVAALKDITKRQEHLIAELNHALHGKRSEKLSEDERQLAFEDLSIALAEVEAEKEKRVAKASDGATKPAPKRTIGNLPAALPRIEEIIEPASLICPCGCGVMHKIGEDRSERLDIVPAQLRVIVTVRPKYACRTCTDGVTQAPAPSHLITGGLPTEAAIAHVLVACPHLVARFKSNAWWAWRLWLMGAARPAKAGRAVLAVCSRGSSAGAVCCSAVANSR